MPYGYFARRAEVWSDEGELVRVIADLPVSDEVPRMGVPTGPRQVLDVVADRFRLSSAEKARVVEAIEVALKRGSGRLRRGRAAVWAEVPITWRV